MTDKTQAQLVEQAIATLFKVSDFFTSNGDAGNQGDMHEKKMAYGILLQSCDLMEMTRNGIEKKIADIKHELAQVRFTVKSFSGYIYTLLSNWTTYKGASSSMYK